MCCFVRFKFFLSVILISFFAIRYEVATAASWWGDSDYVHGVSHVSVQDLAKALHAGRVLFVDTREPEEFAESRIPGSINIRLMDVDSADVEAFKKYDYVVPYCMKDFRGFEVARALRDKKKLSNVVMMNPSGLVGWKASGLPLAIGGNDGVRELDHWLKNKTHAVVGELE